jgi:hypothetical protein
MRTYSTREAAKLIGIHWVTLHHWLGAKKVRPSIAVPIGGGRTLWRWTPSDVSQVRKYKAANYGKGRGPKKRA